MSYIRRQDLKRIKPGHYTVEKKNSYKIKGESKHWTVYIKQKGRWEILTFKNYGFKYYSRELETLDDCMTDIELYEKKL